MKAENPLAVINPERGQAHVQATRRLAVATSHLVDRAAGLNLVPFQSVAVLRNLCMETMGSGTAAVVTSDHGVGKTIAARKARAVLSGKGISTRILFLDCKFMNDVDELQRHAATQIGVKYSQRRSAQEVFEITKQQICKRHIRLIIVDHADFLSPDSQAYLFSLIQDVQGAKTSNHGVGLILMMNDCTGICATAKKLGHFLRRVALPRLTPTEVANYLCLACPSLKAEMIRKGPGVIDLVRDLCLRSRQLPLTLIGLIRTVRLEAETDEDSVAVFHSTLMRLTAT